MSNPNGTAARSKTLTDNIVAKTQDSVYQRRKRRPSFTFHTAYARLNSRTELEAHLAAPSTEQKAIAYAAEQERIANGG